MPKTRSFKLVAPNDRPPTEVSQLEKAINDRNQASGKARRLAQKRSPKR
jgi:hypothetical protein